MRDSLKITVPYQFMRILLTALAAAGITFIFGIFIFYNFIDMPVAKQILSCVLLCVWVALLYTTSKKLALKDNKPYTPLKPSKIKGFLFGGQISAINIVLTLIFIFVWKNFANDEGLVGVGPIAYNAFYYFWTFSYNGLMTGFFRGNIGIIAILAMVVVPSAATGLGYIAGCNKFDITEKMDTFIYEKEDKKTDSQKGENKDDTSGNN